MHVKLGKYMIQLDEQDLHLLDAGYCFRAQDRSTKNYRRFYVKAGKKDGSYLHSLIMKPPKGLYVDHINGDGLDNRRCNLRIGTRSQNMANARRRTGASGYRGVRKMADGPNWTAVITVNNKNIEKHGIPTAEKAARIRDQMALEHFGEFATLNFPREDQ